MASLNKVFVLGNLGSDPELRYTGNQTPVVNFTIATSHKPAPDKPEVTEWHKIVVWGKQAESAKKYLFKGSKALVEGRLQTRQWEQNGQKHYSTEIVALGVTFLDSKAERSEHQPSAAGQMPMLQQQTSPSAVGFDEIPF